MRGNSVATNIMSGHAALNDSADDEAGGARRRKPLHVWISAVMALLSLYNFVEHFFFLPTTSTIRTTLNNSTPPRRRRLSNKNASVKTRVLYILTSINEFDNGLRQTVRGHDRFTSTLLPVARESTVTMTKSGYDVDVYLITDYFVSEKRRDELRAALPYGVALTVWDDAMPLGYDDDSKTQLVPIKRSLARQHRYVIKDLFDSYDVFCAFEDDMIVKGEHVRQFLQLTQDLYDMRQRAPETLAETNPKTMAQVFHGPMTALQLERCVPGFLRVELSQDGYKPHRRNLQSQIPISYDWNDTTTVKINASVCCQWSSTEKSISTAHTPAALTGDQLYFWETSIDALGVRQLPNDKWVLLQAGNTDEHYVDSKFVVGDYWTGRPGYFSVRPDPTDSRYVNNQGGWMASRRQLVDWHVRWCRGGFLPPYDPPWFAQDGLEGRTVEYWSGGIQIAGILACNLQRIMSLDPLEFSKQLLYHSSNNKQKSRNIQYKFSSRTVQEFWGQLNTIRKNATAVRKKEMGLI
jgi:hypothetical protein